MDPTAKILNSYSLLLNSSSNGDVLPSARSMKLMVGCAVRARRLRALPIDRKMSSIVSTSENRLQLFAMIAKPFVSVVKEDFHITLRCPSRGFAQLGAVRDGNWNVSQTLFQTRIDRHGFAGACPPT